MIICLLTPEERRAAESVLRTFEQQRAGAQRGIDRLRRQLGMPAEQMPDNRARTRAPNYERLNEEVLGAKEQEGPLLGQGAVCIQDLVKADIEARKQVGIERYGTTLQPHNGRDGLLDLYQELLDACNYTRQLIYERDGK